MEVCRRAGTSGATGYLALGSGCRVAGRVAVVSCGFAGVTDKRLAGDTLISLVSSFANRAASPACWGS